MRGRRGGLVDVAIALPFLLGSLIVGLLEALSTVMERASRALDTPRRGAPRSRASGAQLRQPSTSPVPADPTVYPGRPSLPSAGFTSSDLCEANTRGGAACGYQARYARTVEGRQFRYCGHHRNAPGARERRFLKDLGQYRRELSRWEEAQNRVTLLVEQYRGEAAEALETIPSHGLSADQQRLLWLAGPALARQHPRQNHRQIAWFVLVEQGRYEVDEGTLSIERVALAAETRVPRATADDPVVAAELWLDRMSDGVIDQLGLGLSPSWQRRAIHAGEPLVRALSRHRGQLDENLLLAATDLARDVRRLSETEQEKLIAELLAERSVLIGGDVVTAGNVHTPAPSRETSWPARRQWRWVFGGVAAALVAVIVIAALLS